MTVDGQVVIIDDERGVLDVLCDLLEMEGYSTVCVDRPELLKTVEGALRPDLFLIDIMLPGISGIEVAEQLQEAGFASVPKVAMSASTFMLDAARSVGVFQDILAKPFDIDTVLDTVHRHVTGARAS